ncbi:MAG: glycosyltransferase family 4 protein [Candidatus Roizmanbacteria bacterium]|nr:glycosyltransferase family 4 protein [Candidatus Roizmanbacteria bacterium]
MNILADKKKIQIITEYFYPVVGGMELNILNTSKHLVEDGWNVAVFTTKNNRDQKNVLKDRAKIYGIVVKRKPYFSYAYSPFSLGVNYHSSGVICLANLSVRPGIFVLLYALFLKIFGWKKFILIFSSHGQFGQSLKVHPSIEFFLKSIIEKTIGVFLINSVVDGIHAVSETEKNKLIKAGIKSILITVIKNGVDEDAYKYEQEQFLKPETKDLVKNLGDYILQVGRIERIKNFESVVKALPHIDAKINFAILGPDENRKYKNEILALVDELNLGHRVHFLGSVTGLAKYYLMRRAKIVTQMSISEGFGSTLYEAMTQGCVCIVSKNTALEELIKDGVNGFCVPATDYLKLAEKINFILEKSDKNLLTKMGNANITLTKDKSWRNIATELSRFYIGYLNSEK